MSEEVEAKPRHCEQKLADGSACPNAGSWMPILLLYPSVLHGPSKAMTVQVDLALCAQHKDQATVKQIATDGIYHAAEQACANARVPWPERTLTRLKFLPYTETPLGKIRDRERAAAN